MKESFQIDRTDGKLYPLGATAVAKGVHFSIASQGVSCALLLYRKGSDLPQARIELPESMRTGDVWNATLLGEFEGLTYAYEVEGKVIPDPYGKQFTGMEQWGSLERLGRPVRTPVPGPDLPYDWEDDSLPRIPYEECIIYRIHARGFTKHPSSGVEPSIRGTFKGIVEKIPYMKELGVTTLELMPPVEFEEIILPKHRDNPFGPEKPDGKLNYWGYTRGYSFAPKSSYSSGRVKEPEKEFKDMVKALHRAGLELVTELFFDGTEAPSHVLDAVRFWAREYHVDGIHLVGNVPLKLLGEDPYLSGLKLFAPGWEGVKPGAAKHLAQYNDGFMMDIRGLLKGDEGHMDRLAHHTRNNPERVGVINYMANTNGFTMMDMVSYDRKHNEANGEDNRDGTDYNLTWNCGEEGPSRKKRVVQMRRKQVRNAMALLFLSQGTPLLMAGDEFGRTKKGNNNSYCQDNEVSWINWKLQDTNRDLYEFTKALIAFRKEHPMFHLPKEPRLMDYNSVGLPDVSYHGLKTWCPRFENYCRQLGILYCGAYGKKDGGEDNYFYVAYNMHWEPCEFALPNLPGNLGWHVALDTDSDAGINPQGRGEMMDNQKGVRVMARSIMVLIGREGEHKKEGKAQTGKSGRKAGRKSQGPLEIQTDPSRMEEGSGKSC